MEWFEELPLNYSAMGARSALRLLKRAYTKAPVLEQVATLAGLQVGQINFNQAAELLPMEIMNEAAREGRMANLLAEVLIDKAAARIHDEMWRVLGDGAPQIHTAALGAKADYDRAAALPSASVPMVNGIAGDLQKIVNVSAFFSDAAMLRFELAQREARVLRIEVHGIGEGTGWLVAENIVLTAFHVIEKAIDNLTKVATRFDYKFVPELGGKLLSKGREIKLAKEHPLLASSRHAVTDIELSEQGPSDANLLDFALLRLAEPVGKQGIGSGGQGEERGWFRLPTEVHDFNTAEGLFVLGHPQLKGDEEAGPLKLTLALPSQAEMITSMNRVRYSVNTEGGNSGSPVMDQRLMPVALHHAGSVGTPKWDIKGVWKGGFNQGTPLHLIVAEIRRQLAGSAILDELSL